MVKQLAADTRDDAQVLLEEQAWAEAAERWTLAGRVEGAKIIAGSVNAKYSALGLLRPIMEYSIRRNAGQGAGSVPQHGGHNRKTPSVVFDAVAAYAKLEQMAGEEHSAKTLRKKVEAVASDSGHACGHPKNLVSHMNKEHPELMPSSKKYTEKNRWDWADRGLYCEWFDGWKCFLIENGYAFDQPELDNEGNVVSEVTFFPGKKAYIINMDETQVPIDGKSRSTNHVSNRVMICNELPRPGRPATKTSGHCTFILTINELNELNELKTRQQPRRGFQQTPSCWCANLWC